MADWISVDERLPLRAADGGYSTVLVIHKYKCDNPDSMVDLAYCLGRDFWIGIYEQKLHHITHWLPLPAFPKNNNLVDFSYSRPIDRSDIITIGDIPAGIRNGR